MRRDVETGKEQGGLRGLPSVDRLLNASQVRQLAAEFGHETVVVATRDVLEAARQAIRSGAPAPTSEDLIARLRLAVEASWGPRLRQVINATGVIIHTNLGRAPLSAEALAAVAQVAGGYSNLEYDLSAGERGSRHAHAATLLARLTGAEDGLVVNNNAAAVLLALSALATGREVIVSRGQAVEIGGGFRIPDVLRQSGARLVEVGTTNRTYTRDYEQAIGPETALLLRVHSSNFRLVGFTHEVALEELCALGKMHGIAVLDDLGSGALLDSSLYGLAREPMPQESVREGSALVCFSGDKLLGGPQAGLIVGQRDYVERLRRHPLARALRVDKMTLAALQSTLAHYARGEAIERVPVWRMIAAPLDSLEARAGRWAYTLEQWGVHATVEESSSAVGGGSLPGETLPSRALALEEGEAQRIGLNLDVLAARLRVGNPPVVGHIERGLLLLDARTVLPEEDTALLGAARAALGV